MNFSWIEIIRPYSSPYFTSFIQCKLRSLIKYFGTIQMICVSSQHITYIMTSSMSNDIISDVGYTFTQLMAVAQNTRA